MKFLLFVALVSVCHGDEEHVDARVVKSLVDDLLYDENGKLATNYVFFPFDNEDCGPEELVGATIYGFQVRPVADAAWRAIFGEPPEETNSCRAVCVERGTDRTLVHAVMPHRHWDEKSTENDDNFLEWFDNNCKEVEVCLMQYYSPDHPIKTYWVSRDSNGGEEEWVDHLELQYGERGTRCFTSYIGHEFVVVSQSAHGKEEVVIDRFVVDYMTTKSIGNQPPYKIPKEYDFEKEIKYTLLGEWERHKKVKRTFSELGFKRGRLPDDLFANMGAFYYNNRHNKILEEWEDKGVFVNWWESDVYFIQIPWATRGMWQQRLLELVQAWAGVPIEQTDMYGLRQYEQGARLLTHVDREHTHAVSLIVNIDQGNLSQPWPIEVNDHADRLHEVIIEPGDIVYYESAKALHGRNRPLTGKGAYYVNLFTHYRPIGDSQWFEKTNPPGVPEPLLRTTGECRLETTTTTNLPSTTLTTGTQHQLGLVQSVQCDDPRLGPYLSPTLFKATNGDDLFAWWKFTAPTSTKGLVEEQQSSSSSTGEEQKKKHDEL